jgi:hypothetical protein
MMKNTKGQSTIEFILTFSGTIGFIMLFLKMSLNYTNGYIVQHAVFMASRAYLVHDNQLGDVNPGADSARDNAAATHAKNIFNKYLPTGLIKGFDGTFKINQPPPDNIAAFVGAWVEFSQRFSIGFLGGTDTVPFRAESFLGREPTRFEGYFQTCAAIQAVVPESNCNIHVTIDDNGG